MIIGKWGNFTKDEKHPSSWTNSGDILKQYFKTKSPVEYGQCWVFAHVLVSLYRTLGIPCRAISNMPSAHPNNGRLVVKKCIDDQNNEVDAFPQDATWTFHVWNEIYCKRPDLSPRGEFDGWQAVDGTPQELSDGVFKSGPTSLAAIRQVLLNKIYDTRFVYSEVASEYHYYQYFKSNNSCVLVHKSKNR